MLVWYGHAAEIQFVNVTEASGIRFKHAGGIDLRVVPALVGSGAAWRDYDNNGTLDLYIVNSTAVRPEPGATLPKNVLYRNNGDGTFTDVTDIAGVGDTGWGMGCAFVDYDNDGDPDLYVTNYKANVFYLNRGDGTFKRFTSGQEVSDIQDSGRVLRGAITMPMVSLTFTWATILNIAMNLT